MKIAEYLCLKCNHKYLDNPGMTTCPVCNHNYIKWLNYDELKKKKII